jgi:retinol dehydrogenase-12
MDFIRETLFLGSPLWDDSRDVPDLSGKVAIVTGGGVGCGLRVTRAFMKKNCHVFIATRSKEKSDAAIAKLRDEIKTGEVTFIRVDLGDLSTIKPFADEFTKLSSKLDILVCNAGVMSPPDGSKTKDGYELQLGTNTIGHFALTQALLPILLSTAEQTHNVRVVHVSSNAHRMAPRPSIPWDDEAFWNKTGSKFPQYGASKCGNILIAQQMDALYREKGIITTCCNPGAIKSDLQRYHSSFERWIMNTFMLYPIEYGGIVITCSATSPNLKGGEYLVPWGRTMSPRRELLEDTLQKETWSRLVLEIKKHGCVVNQE